MGIKFVGVLLRFGFNDKAARENPRECNERSGFKFLMSDDGRGKPPAALWAQRMEAGGRHSCAAWAYGG